MVRPCAATIGTYASSNSVVAADAGGMYLPLQQIDERGSQLYGELHKLPPGQQNFIDRPAAVPPPGRPY